MNVLKQLLLGAVLLVAVGVLAASLYSMADSMAQRVLATLEQMDRNLNR